MGGRYQVVLGTSLYDEDLWFAPPNKTALVGLDKSPRGRQPPRWAGDINRGVDNVGIEAEPRVRPNT